MFINIINRELVGNFMLFQKLNVGEVYIIKQSNSDLRINFINRLFSDVPCDLDTVHLIYFKLIG